MSGYSLGGVGTLEVGIFTMGEAIRRWKGSFKGGSLGVANPEVSTQVAYYFKLTAGVT